MFKYVRKMKNAVPVRFCTTKECNTILFKADLSNVCPDCGEVSIYKVTDVKFTCEESGS